MNPGPVEEAGKVAGGFMKAMTSQPVMLGLVVVVLTLIGMLFFTLRMVNEARRNEIQMIFAQQKEVQELLSRCVVQPTRGGFPLPQG